MLIYIYIISNYEREKDNELKSRILISGENIEVIQNALQMFYEYLYSTEEKIIDKNEFMNIIGKRNQIINAMINEIETEYIINCKYKEHFSEEDIKMKNSRDINWIESLKLTIFVNRNNNSIWIYGPEFMRNALKNYISSIILMKRFFSFSYLNKDRNICYIVLYILKNILNNKFNVKFKICEKTNNEFECNYENYILFQVRDKNNIININGIRMILNEFMEGTRIINIENYKNIFNKNLFDNLWKILANKYNVKLLGNDLGDIKELNDNLKEFKQSIYDSKIIIVGKKEDSDLFQQKMVDIIKEYQSNNVTSDDKLIELYLNQ